jgi:hypothetical protein
VRTPFTVLEEFRQLVEHPVPHKGSPQRGP